MLATTNRSATKFWQAVQEGDIERVLARGKRPDGRHAIACRFDAQNTCLHLACQKLNIDMILALFEVIDHHHQQQQQQQQAVGASTKRASEAFEPCKIVNIINASGRTPLMVFVARAACSTLSDEQIESVLHLFCQNMANVDVVDAQLQNVIHIACRGNSTTAISTILEHLVPRMADLNKYSRDGLTARDWAIVSKHQDANIYLESMGAKASDNGMPHALSLSAILCVDWILDWILDWLLNWNCCL
jgi:hypothetical protein